MYTPPSISAAGSALRNRRASTAYFMSMASQTFQNMAPSAVTNYEQMTVRGHDEASTVGIRGWFCRRLSQSSTKALSTISTWLPLFLFSLPVVRPTTIQINAGMFLAHASSSRVSQEALTMSVQEVRCRRILRKRRKGALDDKQQNTNSVDRFCFCRRHVGRRNGPG